MPARRDFWAHIHELAAAGMTVLVSTHYMDEAERCHQIAYISLGRLLAAGPQRKSCARRTCAPGKSPGPRCHVWPRG
jgi:ABC-2 type transport system ATP-binding protein